MKMITFECPKNSYNPRNVIDIYSAAIFSAVSTAARTWHKQKLCFRFLRGFWKASYSWKKKMFCDISKLRELSV